MRDKTRDKRTGLTLEINADFETVGSAEHREKHVKELNADYTRFLGAVLTNPSDRVAFLALAILEGTLRATVQLARMDEDEVERHLKENAARLIEFLKEKADEQGFGDFSLN